MEEKMARNSLLRCGADSKFRQIAIFRLCYEMQPISWEVVISAIGVHWAEKKYDGGLGMPTNFHYGNGNGHQPDSDDAGALRAGHPPQPHPLRLLGACSSCRASVLGIYDERWLYLRELYDMSC